MEHGGSGVVCGVWFSFAVMEKLRSKLATGAEKLARFPWIVIGWLRSGARVVRRLTPYLLNSRMMGFELCILVLEMFEGRPLFVKRAETSDPFRFVFFIVLAIPVSWENPVA